MTQPSPRRTNGAAQAKSKAPPARTSVEEAQQELLTTVGEKEQRKIQARQQRTGVWFGLGMFGIIGWSVAVPVLLGVALGLWLDRRWEGPQSWTLMLLFVGFVLGCANAWYWVMREHRAIEQTMFRRERDVERTSRHIARLEQSGSDRAGDAEENSHHD